MEPPENAGPQRCPAGDGIADPNGTRPTVMVGLDRWHVDCQPARQRHGLEHQLPPHARPAKQPPAKPVSMDSEAIRRMRRR